MKRFLQNQLLRSGYCISRAVDRPDVEKFLKGLRPIESDKELVRIGGMGDGGYLVPDDLEGIEYCFSPGVSRTVTFETDLANRGVTSFLADYSVDGPPEDSDMLHFEKRFLGTENNEIYMTLENWIGRCLPSTAGDLLLQMDIEGGEYGVILETLPDTLKRFRIAVIEFHGLDSLFHRMGFRFITWCFQKLRADFQIVHIHPNNASPPVKRAGLEIPPTIEFTFLRRDRVLSSVPSTRFPHELDCANVLNRPDVVLPQCWYR